MQALLVVAYTLFFLWLISRIRFFHLPQIRPVYIYSLFILKVLCGCALGLLYTYYYTTPNTQDTFKFFEDSRVMFSALFVKPVHFLEMFTGINGNADHLKPYYEKMNAWNNIDVLFNDNKTLVRVNVIFNFFSLGYYYVHVVFLNMLSFTGLIALFKVFQSYNPARSKLLFFGTLCLPSLLFWGSGLLKDGLLIFALGLLLYSFKRRFLFSFLIGLLLLMFTKLYVLIIIIPGLVAWYWSKNDSAKKIFIKFLTCYALYFLIGFNVGRLNNKYDVAELLYYKQQNFYLIGENTKAQSLIAIPRFDATAWSLVKNTPSAILRVFIRPWPSDAHSLFIWMAVIENALIILLLVASLIFMRVNGNINHSFFWFSVFFVICMFALIGLITPILGAMVRYKVVALPFLMFILISLYKKPPDESLPQEKH